MPRVSSTLRAVFALVSVSGLAAGSAGCTHMVESRVISAFAQAIETDNVAALKDSTTEDFEQKALRRNKAVTSLKLNIPDLPTADLKVVKVVDEGTDAKRVQVEVADSGRKVWYRLKQDERRGWVVDDVFLDKRELQNGQSVAARLDLVLSLQAFLEVWGKGDEAGLQACTTPGLCDNLFRLPESERTRMMARLTGEAVTADDLVNLRPELELRDETADCRLARSDADLTVRFERHEGQWKVNDLALASRKGESVSSVLRMAQVTLASLAFETAYASGDKESLRKVASRRFYEGSLMAADLSIAALPSLDQDKDGPEVAVDENSGSFLLQSEKEVVRFGLVRDPNARDGEFAYRVDDVTLYELDGTQNKRLSSLFTAHAVMLLFHDALQKRSLKDLQLNATHDFNTRVFNRVDSALLKRLPLDRVPEGPVEVVSPVFQGQVTSITVTCGEQPMTYVLRDEQGKVLVDDVQVPVPGQPESLKTTCDVLIPVYHMLDALEAGKIETVRGQASRDFNRMVWNQLSEIPDPPVAIADHFAPGMRSLAWKPEKCAVVFGDSKCGANVLLVKEGDAFRIDDVQFRTGLENPEPLSFKRSIRERIQSGELTQTPKTALAPE